MNESSSGHGVYPYKTIDGHDAYSARGPKGTFLATQSRTGWEVWRSDSLSTRSTHSSAESAITAACRYAGITS